MHVILEDDVAVDVESTVALEESDAVQNDLRGVGAGENRGPVEDGTGHEVGCAWITEAVAAAPHLIGLPW